VSAGVLVLPLTIAAELFITATLLSADFVTAAIRVAGACALVAAVLVRLHQLMQLWRSRIGRKALAPPERRLQDGSTLLARGGKYMVILLLVGYFFAVLSAIEQVTEPVPVKIFEALFVAPVLVWSLSVVWWYRLHRELAGCGRSAGILLVRAPILSIVAPLSLAGTAIIGFVWNIYTSASAGTASSLLLFFGLVSMPVSVYRLGRSLEQLRRRAPSHKGWKIRVAGLRAAIMVLVPVPAIPYFQHSLDRISLELAAGTQLPAPTHRARHPRLRSARIR
jgi:hypothetical protein